MSETAADYKIPHTFGESEFTEKRSRFIGKVWYVTSEEEARARIEETKKKHYDARHNCWCYLLRRDGTVRYSDDGEPQGTAGQPMLNVFQRKEVFDVCCVVTRYFGGILLGTGGLTRAEPKGAIDALATAGISRMCLWEKTDLSVSYAEYEQIKLLVEGLGGQLADTEWGSDVTLHLTLPRGGSALLQNKLTEFSAGRLILESKGEVFRAGPREEAK